MGICPIDTNGPDISGVMVQELALGWIHKASNFQRTVIKFVCKLSNLCAGTVVYTNMFTRHGTKRKRVRICRECGGRHHNG